MVPSRQDARWLVSICRRDKKCGIKSEAREGRFCGADQVRDAAGVALDHMGAAFTSRNVLEADAFSATEIWRSAATKSMFPTAMILPGWYGVPEIKCLSRIEFIDDRRYEVPICPPSIPACYSPHVSADGRRDSISRTR